MSNYQSPRDGYGEVLVRLGEEHQNLFVLTADLATATKTQGFGKRFPDRFLNVGIAEQNMVGVAAGLARVGFIPVMSTFACFAPGRCYDQIRQQIAYSNANVKIISTHPGLSIGMDGAIHQSLDDLSLMRELPNMVVLAPSDVVETKKVVEEAINHEGPVYVRVGRKPCPVLFPDDVPFTIGKGYVLKTGEDITLMAHGAMVAVMVEAGKELGARGIDTRVINMPTIKPMDVDLVVKSARETLGIVTVEDHFLTGGLHSAVSEITSEQHPCIVKGVGVEDTFGESGAPNDLYEKYGLTKEHIVRKALEIIDIKKEK